MFSLNEISERMRVSKRTIMRRVDEHRFPQPVIREGRVILWREDVVERYLRRRRKEKKSHDRSTRRKTANKRVGRPARTVARRLAHERD